MTCTRAAAIALCTAALVLQSRVASAGTSTTVTYSNGLELTLDNQTGQVLTMSHPLLGTFLSTTPVANPMTSTHWSTLSDDGTTVTLEATVTNTSASTLTFAVDGAASPLSAFAFPDLQGLVPPNGADPLDVELRMAMGVINPFAPPAAGAAPTPFARDYAGDLYQPYALRWVDYGTHAAGVSFFQNAWLTETTDHGTLRSHPTLHVEQASNGTVRIAWVTYVTLAPNETWTSDPFSITPHKGGWAEGIGPFRAFVQSPGTRPPRPRSALPAHVLNGLGMRTAWMIDQDQPARAPEPNFAYADVPTLAEDAAAAGLEELMIIGSVAYGALPICYQPMLGPLSDFENGAAAARAMGVHVSPFINFQQVNLAAPASCPSPVPPTTWGPIDYANEGSMFQFCEWEYAPSLIPALESPGVVSADAFPYSPFGVTDFYPLSAQALPSFESALGDTLVSDWSTGAGISSFFMDVFTDDGTTALEDAILSIRPSLTMHDPESVFAGEVNGMSFERAALVLDYSAGWSEYTEADAFTSVMPTPRIAVNVSSSPLVASMAFIDGLYLNAFPSKPDRANGSALISADPTMAKTYAVLASLRAAYAASYFTIGTFIGDSILSAPVTPFVRYNRAPWIGGATIQLDALEHPDVIVKAWVSGDGASMLVFVLNATAAPLSVSFQSNPGDFVSRATGFSVTQKDAALTTIATSHAPAQAWHANVGTLSPLGLAILELQ